MLGVNEREEFIWVNVLRNIPGVSEIKAVAIFKKYPNFIHLMESYDLLENEKDKKTML